MSLECSTVREKIQSIIINEYSEGHGRRWQRSSGYFEVIGVNSCDFPALIQSRAVAQGTVHSGRWNAQGGNKYHQVANADFRRTTPRTVYDWGAR